MPNYQNTSPYFDDTQNAINNDYVEILFRPGRAVQARELTQIQSLLQYQVSQLGDFLFQDGSPVTGGHITFDNSVLSVQLVANDTISLSDFSDKLLINPTGPVVTRAIVIATDDSVSSNTVEGALIVKYLSGSQFNDGDNLQIATGTQESAQLIPANSTNRGSIVSINEGVFYADGYFVFVAQQTIVLDSLNPLPSYRVGLQINPSVISSSLDSSLLDPAQGSFNYQAPGADRYQYQLLLSKRDLTSTDDSQFFELMRIENGVVTSQVEYPILGNIDNELAARTYDADGNFTVTPFIVSAIDDPANSSSFLLNIGPGKAYVEGYEYETIAPMKMSEAKAQTTNAASNYQLSLEFGNYLTVTNLYTGNVAGFNTGNFGQLDLHIVPSGNVNTKNAQAYANTYVGTARIRDFEYVGASTWDAYVLDVNVTPIVVNANAVSANTTSLSLPPTFTASVNAFQNVAVTILAGNSSGDTRTIRSYDAPSKTAYLDRPTTQLLDTTSKLSIQFGIKDVNGLVFHPATTTANQFYTQNVTAGLYPCMDISTNGGKDTLGNTILFNSNFNRLDFLLPQPFIAQNNFSNVTFMNRKTLANVAFTAGNTTIGTGSGLDPNEVYTFGLTNQFLPDAITRNNFLVVVRNAQTSNLANGMIITWDEGSISAGNGVFQTDSTHVTLKTVTTGNFVADVLITVQDNNASVNFRRSKTLTGNTSNTVLRATDSYLNGTAVIGTTNVNAKYLDTANGFLWFVNWADIQKNPGIPQNIDIPDVIQIIKIYDSGSPTQMPNTTNAIDITTNYLFDSGQRDNYYDHASIILRDGMNPPVGQTVVMFQYYAHDATSGFFSADSYTAANYANNYIPVYDSPRFGEINLRDSIDFRPTRTIGSTANVQSLTLNGLRLPQPSDAMTISYAWYLGRIDKLALSHLRQFKLLQGVPALSPQIPADLPGSMTLYTMQIDPYTYSAANVTLNYNENKRYTMRDIGKLDSRINQLEYQASLSALDSQAFGTNILYQNGTTAKEQFGIVTDSFVDFSVADVDNPDLSCHISGGLLKPYQIVTPVQFNFKSATGPYGVNDRTYSVSFTETPILVQNNASDFLQIQPYAFGQFNGDVLMRPQTDIWYSNSIVPQILAGPPVPPKPPAPPAPPASNVGLTGTGNKANLAPPTVTHTPTPTSPPKTGSPQLAAKPVNNYCIDSDFWWNGWGHSWYSTNGRYYYGGQYLNGYNYYGPLCRGFFNDYTGYGIMRVGYNWVPSATTSLSIAGKPIVYSGIGITGTGSGITGH